jgi:general secretion pathway protein I
MALFKPLKCRDSDGFMLIEVLVALFIIALLMAALIKSTTDNMRDMIILKNKTIASWVASNIIANIQLGIISPTASSGSDNKQSFKIPMMGQMWYGIANFQNTAQKNVWRVDVEVKPTSFTTQSVIHVITYFNTLDPAAEG